MTEVLKHATAEYNELLKKGIRIETRILESIRQMPPQTQMAEPTLLSINGDRNMTEVILQKTVKYDELLKIVVGKTIKILDKALRQPHQKKRAEYENTMRTIRLKQYEAEQAKLNMIEIDKNIREINTHLDEYIEIIEQIAMEINKSGVATSETITREQLQKHEAEQAKLIMIEIDKNIREINRQLDEYIENIDQVAMEINKSRVSTLETIVREQLKNPGINVDENQYFFVPSIGKDAKITRLLTERERKDDEDYLGGKKKRRRTRRMRRKSKKGGRKSKKMRK